MLKEHGGSVEALDAEGKTPILYAIYEEVGFLNKQVDYLQMNIKLLINFSTIR